MGGACFWRQGGGFCNQGGGGGGVVWLVLVAAHVHVDVDIQRIIKNETQVNTNVGQALLACRIKFFPVTAPAPGRSDLVSIRTYWTSSCTSIQAENVYPVPLQYWASATDLCTRTSTINGLTLCVNVIYWNSTQPRKWVHFKSHLFLTTDYQKT